MIRLGLQLVVLALCIACRASQERESSSVSSDSDEYRDYITAYAVSSIVRTIYDQEIGGRSKTLFDGSASCPVEGSVWIAGEARIRQVKSGTTELNLSYDFKNCRVKNEYYDLIITGKVSETGKLNDATSRDTLTFHADHLVMVGTLIKASSTIDFDCEVDIASTSITGNGNREEFTGKICARIVSNP